MIVIDWTRGVVPDVTVLRAGACSQTVERLYERSPATGRHIV